MISSSDGGTSRATASTSSSSMSSENNQQQQRNIQEDRRSLAARNVVVLHDPNDRSATTTSTSTWVPSDDTPPPPPPPHVFLGSATSAPVCSSNHELIALKEARRLEKNRVKARNARKRKKCMIADLERNVKVITQENEVLRFENADLRRKLVEAELREGKAVAAAADAAGRQAHQNHAVDMALAAAASRGGSMTPLSTSAGLGAAAASAAGLGTAAGAGLDGLLGRHVESHHRHDLSRRLSLGQLHGRAEQLLRDHPTGDDLASQLVKGTSWAPQPPQSSLSTLPAYRDAISTYAGEDIHSPSRIRGVPGGIAVAAGDLNGRGGGSLSLSSLRRPPQLTSPASINVGAANAARLSLPPGVGVGAANASTLSFLESQKRHQHLLRGVDAVDAVPDGGDDRDILARRGGGTL